MRASCWAPVCLIALLGGCARPAPSASSGASEEAATAAASAVATPNGVAASAWQLAKLYQYHFVLSTTLAMNDNPAFDFDLTGSLRVMTVSSSPSGTSLYLTVDGAKAVSRIPSAQAELDKTAAQVASTGCFLDLENGKVSAWHFPVGLAPLAANVYRELGADLQFVPGGSAPYSEQEYDTTGQYVAEYTPQADALHFKKQKQRYVGILGGKVQNVLMPSASIQLVPQVIASDEELTVNAAFRPTLVHAKNQVLVNGAQVPIKSTTQVSLEAADEQPLPAPSPDFVGMLGKTVRLAAEEPYGGQVSVDALDDARIHGETFASLYAELGKLPNAADLGSAANAVPPASAAASPAAGQKAPADAGRVFIALAALFRRQPATVALALQKIRQNAPGADVLVDALGSASSVVSQQALLSLLEDKTLNPKLATRVTRSLSRAQRPSEAAVTALEQLLKAKPFDQVPLYGLGTYCRRLREDNQIERSNAIGDLLLQQLTTAQTQTALTTVLEALSNAGYARAFAPIQAYLKDPRDLVRTAAVRGLQSIKDIHVDPVLANVISTEQVAAVRIAAMDAEVMREPTEQVAGAVTLAATQATDPRVRFRAVELMSQWLQRWPAFRGTLQTVASNDAEDKVRERAKAAL